MDELAYMKDRVDDQIAWYDKKSSKNKKYTITIRVVEVILSASIATVAVIVPATFLQATVAIIGLALTITAGIGTINKFQDNWIQYRMMAEALKREKCLYMTKSGHYKNGDTFTLFVERVETLTSKENFEWFQYMAKTTEEKKGPEK